MVSSRNSLAVYTVAKNILDCVVRRLVMAEIDLPDRRCVIAGDIAWDDCECGQLVVAIGRTFTSDVFPNEQSGDILAPCGGNYQVTEFLISILRCSPSGGDDPAPPSCEALDAAAQVAVLDAWAVRTAMQCCLPDWKTQRETLPFGGPTLISEYLIGVQNMVGPDGQCQGSELTVTIGILNGCIDCGDES